MAVIEVKVPNLGDFQDVEIIEVHVAVGDTVKAEGTLITLETDKAAMEVPSTAAGVVKEILVKQGDRVSEGQLIVRLEGEAVVAPAAPGASTAQPAPKAASAAAPEAPPAAPPSAAKSMPAGAASYAGPVDIETGLLVLGAGPGGYPAAFRAADLGLKVTLVERWAVLGGVCLNVGCIPSKALLHAAKVIEDVEGMADCGLRFGEPQIDIDALRDWKDRTVGKLTGGLATLAQKRKVDIVRGTGSFLSPYHLEVVDGEQRTVIAFQQCVIAAG
ncbi:MAG: FAD-dependent oxidoreductase, partial [Gammaproteobacteria bacterium]|nr:FAD-dependent oxidoreductase [Gammaproteobacteria bacterium]